jgi:hypothetical protein
MIRENTIISVIQKKGDIRKTALAFSLARDLGLRYSNNDLLEREKRQHIGFGYEVKPYFVYDLDYENWLDTYAEFVVWKRARAKGRGRWDHHLAVWLDDGA